MNDDNGPDDLFVQVEKDLGHVSRTLRFSDAVEARFQASRISERISHFVALALAVSISFSLLLWPVVAIVPDVQRVLILLQLAVVTPVSLSIVFLVHRRLLAPESVVVNLLATCGVVLYAASASHSPDAAFLLFTLPIFIVLSNIVLPLPFVVATGYTFLTTAIASWTVLASRQLHLGVRVLLLSIECAMGGYTLLAAYRLERGERRHYLLALRESLRGATLTEQNRELADLSETDGLTGVPNRRVFDRLLADMWSDHQRSRTPLALLIIDIDHFKRLNDTLGHMNGDVCLQKTAHRLRTLMHPHQSLARYGGEEFAVLLEGEGARDAPAVGERLRRQIEIMPIMLTGTEDTPHHITISIGCASVVPSNGLSPADLFIAADKALYTAKHAGRNRVHASSLHPGKEEAAPTTKARSFEAIPKTNRELPC